MCCTCLSFIKTFVEGRSDSVGTTHQSVFLTSSCIKILQLENSHSPELPECALPSGVLVPPPEPPHCPTTQHAQKGPRIHSNARGQYTVQTDDLKWRLRSLLNAWDGRGDYLFLALHHPVETSHILREACCPFGHQTVSEGERESTPLPISWVLSSSIYMVAERT